MMTMMQAPLYLVRGLLMVQLLLTIGALVLLMWQIIQRRKAKYLINCLLLIVLSQTLHIFMRDLNSYRYKDGVTQMLFPFFARVPVVVVVIATAVCVGWMILTVMEDFRWQRTHITPRSIHESFDRLPVGVCCYFQGGMPRLVNDSMSRLSFALTGQALSNGERFWAALQTGAVLDANTVIQNGDSPMVQLADGRVYAFHLAPIPFDNGTLNELLAVEVTEEYKNIQVLADDKARMLEINRRLREYSRRVVDVTIEKEILDAKVRIHDELGHALIVSKQYINSGGSDRKQILRLWHKNIALLKEERSEDESDDYETIFYIAQCAGVKLLVSGELPSQPKSKRIALTAISECLTNTCRHARGDEIRIKTNCCDGRRIMRFTNNGDAPTAEIVEGGGLGGLRKLVEQVNGTMTVQSRPCFVLTIEMEEEEP